MSNEKKTKKVSKKSGIAHRVMDSVVKTETQLITKMGQFEVDWGKKQTELVQKHNDLVAQIAALEGLTRQVAAFTAGELGRMGGAVQKQLSTLGQATNAIDLNVLALAELLKEVFGQLSQVETLITRLNPNADLILTPDTLAEIKKSAEKWYNDLVASAFKTVQTREAEAEKLRAAKEADEAQKAKEAAELTASLDAESKAIETEFQKAQDMERSVVPVVSGGEGSPYPKGAQFFGDY